MKIQCHPASGKRTVLAWELSPARQRLAASVLLAVAAVLGGFPLLFSTVLSRWRHSESEAEASALYSRRKEALDLATSALRQTASRLAADRDLIGRIAFLYDQPGLARADAPFAKAEAAASEKLSATEAELEFLRGALIKLEEIERSNPDWPQHSPSMSPVPESAFVATTPFGWTVSRLTGEREFVAGLDLACRAGQPVAAPADGVVRWAGPFPLRPGSPYGHLGRIVAIRHGDRAVTVFGYLGSESVRRGQLVRRGERIGTVGMSPWISAPRLRFEVWRLAASGPVPIDPRLSMLNVFGPEVSTALNLALRGAPRNAPELPAEFR